MNGKVAMWIGRVLTVLVSFQFGYSAVAKLFPQTFYPQMTEQMIRIGLPETLLPTLAALEIMCIVLYLIPITAVLGAVLFTGYLGGAILTHLRIGEPVYMHIFLGAVIWLGIYLREGRLQYIFPFRR